MPPTHVSKLRMHTDPSDGRSVIDTRTLALVVGALSLAFGIWAATGAPSEVGLAAGALGLVAGLTAILPVSAHVSVDDRDTGTGARDTDDTRATPVGSPGDAGTADATGTTQTVAPSAAGHFDLDGAPGRHDARHDDSLDGHPDRQVPAHDGVADPPGGSPGPEQGAPDGDSAPAATSLTDPVTGLFSEDYLVVALEGRLASARRHLRPVAVALMQITQGLPDTGSRSADPQVVAEAITDTVRDSDIACRLSADTFGVILEDTPENGAVWTVERIRRNLVSTSGHHTLWAGVACYPAHAFDAGELMAQVHIALDVAKEWNQDRIEVAVAE